MNTRHSIAGWGRSGLAGLGLGLLLVSAPRAAWHWSFDTDPQGWVVADLDTAGPYYPPLAQYSLSHSTAGGCVGGHVQRADPSSNSYAFSLPVEQLPENQDWSGGRLTFCLRSTHSNWTSESFVIVVGGNGTVLRAPIPLPSPAWSSYDLALEPQNFILMNGAQPDAATFQSVLGQVEALFIMAEYGAAVQETTGLDEVRLRPACQPVDVPLVLAETAGTPEAPRVRLAWGEVPGAWDYEILQLDGAWGVATPVGSTVSTQWELPVEGPGLGFYQVRARCE
ncbi:MAG: laminin B domain-containing protein [Candidatus Delongbacteria bacterium]